MLLARSSRRPSQCSQYAPHSTSATKKKPRSALSRLPCPALSWPCQTCLPPQSSEAHTPSPSRTPTPAPTTAPQTSKRERERTNKATLLCRALTQRFIHTFPSAASRRASFHSRLHSGLLPGYPACLGSRRAGHMNHDPSPNLSLSSTTLLPRRWWRAIPQQGGLGDRLAPVNLCVPVARETPDNTATPAAASGARLCNVTEAFCPLKTHRSRENRGEGSTLTLTGTTYAVRCQ